MIHALQHRLGASWVPIRRGSGLGFRAPKSIPKGSNVAPFWVCYVFVVRDYTRLPQQELHRRVWVNITYIGQLGALGIGLRV